MRKYVFLSLLLAATSVSAQQVTVAEPEFINSYCILTSDSTYAILPKESGTVGKHQSKVKKWGRLLGGAASIAGAAGGIIGINAAANGSATGALSGNSYDGHCLQCRECCRCCQRSCRLCRHGHHFQAWTLILCS